jgi:hypothetical protein
MHASETARDRADRRHEERQLQEQEAQPWRIAVGVVFAVWLALHLWLWLQRGLRPRVDGLDSNLTIARYLSASALLWTFLYLPLAAAFAKLRSAPRRRREALSPQQASTDTPQTTFLGKSAATLPILAAIIGASLAFTFAGTLLGMGAIGLFALVALLPWLPLVYMLRRAFPGGRGELVVACLLLFFAVGLAQSVFNRGFYEWHYKFGSIDFRVPTELPANR